METQCLAARSELGRHKTEAEADSTLRTELAKCHRERDGLAIDKTLLLETGVKRLEEITRLRNSEFTQHQSAPSQKRRDPSEVPSNFRSLSQDDKRGAPVAEAPPVGAAAKWGQRTIIEHGSSRW